MIEAGLDDIFVVNTVVGDAQILVLANLAKESRLLVAVDDAENAQALSHAATAARSTLGILIEVDTGMDRAGVDTAQQAHSLARVLINLPGIELEGLTGYEGHCSLTPDRTERAAKHKQAMELLIAIAGRLDKDGVPVPIRSAGGTATWEWTAAYPGVTEIQAGSYVVMDNFHRQMVPEFDIALTVASTVVSRPLGRVIIDAGSKTIAAPEIASLVGYDLEVVRFDEEHGIFADGADAPGLGQMVRVVPGYAPSTVNMFDAYHVIEDGVIVDIWPVVPRGPGHHGLVDQFVSARRAAQ